MHAVGEQNVLCVTVHGCRLSLTLVVGCCRCTCGQCGVPQVIAFSGKRQWSELINIGKRGKAKVTNIPTGLQPTDLRPPVRHHSMITPAGKFCNCVCVFKPKILQELFKGPGDECYACRVGRCQQMQTSGL